MADCLLLGVGVLYFTKGGRYQWGTDGVVTAGIVGVRAGDDGLPLLIGVASG